jgi:hypothetical protein
VIARAQTRAYIPRVSSDPSVLVSWEHTYSVLQWPVLRQLLKGLALAIAIFFVIIVGGVAVTQGEVTLEAMLFPLAVGGLVIGFMIVVSPIVVLVLGTSVRSRFVIGRDDVFSEQLEPRVVATDASPYRSIAWPDVRRAVRHDRLLLVELHGPLDVAVMLHCPDRTTYDQVVSICRAHGL